MNSLHLTPEHLKSQKYKLDYERIKRHKLKKCKFNLFENI